MNGIERAQRRVGAKAASSRHSSTPPAHPAYRRFARAGTFRYRILEVELAANTVNACAADGILARRLGEVHPSDPAEFRDGCAPRNPIAAPRGRFEGPVVRRAASFALLCRSVTHSCAGLRERASLPTNIGAICSRREKQAGNQRFP
jgi:hypothetical protein